ncbi:uncharacterized protein LOC119674142 [Teleopsis dalmanni]|uniref:uncharacterized protein LOC119674142 n=1 Tax=Teleopsis dalmanni TaxID=139649 RepID=UPI0018CE6857|nr:uncharacterized protein LOC119674142 [Teleopsis dalmanni]
MYYIFNKIIILIGFIALNKVRLTVSRYIAQPMYYPGPSYHGPSYPGPSYPGPSYQDTLSHHTGYYGPQYRPAIPYEPYQPTLFSPPGTIYDSRRGVVTTFPGGGIPLLVDYNKRCPGNYRGTQYHPNRHHYYFVCTDYCVIFGKCNGMEVFNNSTGHCGNHPMQHYKPNCVTEGRFPITTDKSIYYRCSYDLTARVYSCPHGMVFSNNSLTVEK